MEVLVVIREDRNDHGFVDTGVCGVYRRRDEAEAAVREGEARARADGFRVLDDDEDRDWDDSDWEVYYTIETHTLD
jgi:hypothetical protein